MNIPDFGRVRTAHALLEDLCKFRQTAEGHPESGGVLIGKHLIRGGRMVINRYTSPQKRDKHGRFMFYRSKDHDRLVQNIWEESKRISTYVGLWHTHPENVPHYSAIDRRDWNKALNRSAYDGKNLFFFIVGRTHIGCWMGTKKILRNSIKMVGKYEIK